MICAIVPLAAVPTMIGKHLEDRFRLDAVLGEGGMAIVYRAFDIVSEKNVAVKVMRNDAPDPNARARFLREVESQSQLKSPNVARIFHFGRDMSTSVLFMVMELVDGDHLGKLLDAGRLPPILAYDIMQQACVALDEAHSLGVIHRDLKPANIMLEPKDCRTQVKLLDFGFARVEDDENPRLTGDGMVGGTLSYASPEELSMIDVDTRLDIYALGVIFFEMMTGRPPFVGATPQMTAIMHLTEDPPRVSDFVEVDEILDELIEWMLKKDPDHRPQTVMEVRFEVVQAFERLGRAPFEPQHSGVSTDIYADWGVIDVPDPVDA